MGRGLDEVESNVERYEGKNITYKRWRDWGKGLDKGKSNVEREKI